MCTACVCDAPATVRDQPASRRVTGLDRPSLHLATTAAAADLLSKSFNYNTKVELKTKTESGVTFTGEAVVSKPGASSGDGAVPRARERTCGGATRVASLRRCARLSVRAPRSTAPVGGAFRRPVTTARRPHFCRPRPPATASALLKAEGGFGAFRADKLQIGTDKKIAGEFSLAEAFPGTKLTFKATDGSRAAGAEAISAVIGAEYKVANATCTVDVDTIAYGVDATALVGYDGACRSGGARVCTKPRGGRPPRRQDPGGRRRGAPIPMLTPRPPTTIAGFLVGGPVKAGLAAAGGVDVRDYNALLGYKAKDYTVGAASEKKFSSVTAFYYHTLSPTINAAAVAKVCCSACVWRRDYGLGWTSARGLAGRPPSGRGGC